MQTHSAEVIHTDSLLPKVYNFQLSTLDTLPGQRTFLDPRKANLSLLSIILIKKESMDLLRRYQNAPDAFLDDSVQGNFRRNSHLSPIDGLANFTRRSSPQGVYFLLGGHRPGETKPPGRT